MSLLNLLRQRGVEVEPYVKQVKTYIHNHPPEGKLGHTLGVSAFGTVESMCEDQLAMHIVLGQSTATINDVFCVGKRLDPENGRGLVLFTSIKGLMMIFMSMNSGYSLGQLMFDYTFKIFKELLSMMTFGIHDIRQKGRFVAFGPSTHEDKQATLEAGQILEPRVKWLVEKIREKAFPECWASGLTTEILKEYTHAVESVEAPRYVFGGVLADCAQAIPNGLIESKIIAPKTGIDTEGTDQTPDVYPTRS